MSTHRLTRIVIALSLFISLGISPASSAGRTNQSSANSVLNGKGAPTAKIGINGDFYIDVLTFNIYGPKTSNRWPTPVSLKGPAGTAGNDGKQGEKGSSLNGSTGAKGEQGEKGEKGDKGEPGEVGAKGEKGDRGLTGDRGATGATGLTGATGATGLSGVQGIKGDKGDIGLTGAQGLVGAQGLTGAQGSTGAQGLKGDTGATGAPGSKGDTGLTGAKGDTGLTGAKGDAGSPGAKGDTGATGATGPSNVQTVSIANFTLATSTPNTSAPSAFFGVLNAGQSYKFEIIVRAQSTYKDGKTGLNLVASGSGHNLSFNYMATSVAEYRNGANWLGYQFLVIGTITVAAGGSSLAVYLIDGSGTSGTYQITANGIALITLVGSVS